MKIKRLYEIFAMLIILFLQKELVAQTHFNIASGASLYEQAYNRTICRRWGCDDFASSKIYGGLLFNPRLDFDVDSIAAMSFSSYIDVGNGKFEVPIMIELHAGNRKKFQLFVGGGLYAGYYNVLPHGRILAGPQVGGGFEFNLLNQRYIIRYSYSKSYLRGYSTDFHKQKAITALIYLNHK